MSRAKTSPMVKSIVSGPIAKPISPDGAPLRKTPVAGAFKLLVADMRKALALKDSRKKLDAILVRADTERRAKTITEQQHTFCSKWHAALVNLMKQSTP